MSLGNDEDWPIEARVVRAFNAARAHGPSLNQLSGSTGLSRDRLQGVLAASTDRQRMRIDELVRISDAIGLGFGDLQDLLWPGHPMVGAYRDIEEKRRQIAALRARVEEVESRFPETPTAQLTQLLAPASDWGFAVLPVFEGPSPTNEVHASNRFAVTPVHGALARVSYDACREAFLRAVGELPPGIDFAKTRAGSSSYADRPFDPRGTHPSAGDYRGLQLVTAVYAADRLPRVEPTYLSGAPGKGIVVLALRQITDRLRLAATLARALGFGLTASHRVAHRSRPRNIADAAATARVSSKSSNLVFSELLAEPLPHTVLTHVGGPADEKNPHSHPLLAPQSDGKAEPPFVVLLSETDRALVVDVSRPANARGDATRLDLQTLRLWRDTLRAHVKGLEIQGTGLVIDFDQPASSRGDEVDESRERWRTTAQNANTALESVLFRGGVRANGFVVNDPEAFAILDSAGHGRWVLGR